jgi:hypothetical protein
MDEAVHTNLRMHGAQACQISCLAAAETITSAPVTTPVDLA